MLALAAGFWSLNGVLIKSIFSEGDGPGGVTISFYRSLFAGLCLWPLTRGKWWTIRRVRKDSFFGVEDHAARAPDQRSAVPTGLGGVSDAGIPGLKAGAILERAHGTNDSRNPPDIGVRTGFPVRPAAVGCMVLFALMTAAFVMAMTRAETASVLILQYTSTFWIFLLSPWFLKEYPRREEVVLLAIAVPGVGIIFAGNASTDAVGLSIALCSGLFFGLLTLLLRHLRDVDPVVMTVFNNLGAAAILFGFCLAAGELAVSRRALVLLAVMGVVQFGLPYYLYSSALRRVPAATAALVTLAEPVLAPVWTFLVLGKEVPTATMLGGSLILLALVMLARNARAKRTPLNPPLVRVEVGGEL